MINYIITSFPVVAEVFLQDIREKEEFQDGKQNE
jgi:hypothetical protein